MGKFFGIVCLLGACYWGFNTVRRDLDTLDLIKNGQTVPGFIVETWKELTETNDETNQEYYSQVAKYTYQLPDGHDFTNEVFISRELRRKIITKNALPYPVEVKYLSDNPTVSCIKSEEMSVLGWTVNLGVGLVIPGLLGALSIGWISKKEKAKEEIENNCVLIWKDFGERKSALEDMFKDILTPKLKTKIKKNRAIVKYYDDRIECENLIGHSIEAMITTKKINEFRQRYSHIRVYHGCRPTNVQSYYEKGVLPSLAVKDVQIDRFREIFPSDGFPEITEEKLQQSIEEIGSTAEDLCLAIDDKHIIERAGHYLIYGSEYLGGLVTNLPIENIEKYNSELREIGKPTFIEINLPNKIEYVSDSVLWVVLERMITEWVYNIAHSRTESSPFDCTISLCETLPPEHIYSHYHPRKITDPLIGHKIYDAETGEYEE
jgi:hypothetical protein